MQRFKFSSIDIPLALDRCSARVVYLPSFWRSKLQEFTSIIKDLSVPKIVKIEVSLNRQLGDAIALLIGYLGFLQRVIFRPEPTFARLDIYLVEGQSVTVLESTTYQA